MAKQKESRSVPGDLLKLTNLIDVFMAEIAVLLETQEENKDNFLELNRKTWALRGVYFTARTHCFSACSKPSSVAVSRS